jgi:hypothetical protein
MEAHPRNTHTVTRGHSRPKDGVASLAYDPRVHTVLRQSTLVRLPSLHPLMDCRVTALARRPGNDAAAEAPGSK